MSDIGRFIIYFSAAAAVLFAGAVVFGPDGGNYAILPAGTDPDAAFEQYPDADYIMIPKGENPPDHSENAIVRSYYDYPLPLVLYDFYVYGLTALILNTDIQGLAAFLKSAAYLCGRRPNSEKRAHLLAYIRSHPGCAAHEIMDAVGIKRGTLRYHVPAIMKQNGVRRIFFENAYYYYAGKDYPGKARGLLALHCRYETRKNIYETICRMPGITGKEIAEITKICKDAVRRHTKKLAADALIEERKIGGILRFYPVLLTPDRNDLSLNAFDVIADPGTN